MPEQARWGTVNLGVDVLQGHGEQFQPGYDQYIGQHRNVLGKQQYNPGRNQELKLPPDIFRMQKNSEKNPYSATGKINRTGMHERIKELLGEGMPRRQAHIQAKQEFEKTDSAPINKKDIYRSKFHDKNGPISPLTSQNQNYPYI